MTPIVLLPGWGFSVAVLSPLGSGLRAAGWRADALELPAATSIETMAEALLVIAPARAIWLGWSLGGMAAVAAAQRAPARVTAVVALGCNPAFLRRPGWPHAMSPRVFGEFAARADHDGSGVLGRFAVLASHGGEEPREDARWLVAAAARRVRPGVECLRPGEEEAGSPVGTGAERSSGVSGLKAHLAVLRDADLRCALPLPVPSLWLFGARDALVPAAVAGDVAALDNRACVGALPGASHASFLRRPESLLPLLDPFLRNC